MKKKKIEKIFQEKLQDFSQIPEEHIWGRISHSLDKKRAKRRILPLWWRLAGVAALLVAGLFIFLPEAGLPDAEEIITDSNGDNPEILLPDTAVPAEKQDGEETIAVTDKESEKDVNNRERAADERAGNSESGSGIPQNEDIVIVADDRDEVFGNKTLAKRTVLRNKNTADKANDTAVNAAAAEIPLQRKEGPMTGAEALIAPDKEFAIIEEKNKTEAKDHPEVIPEGEQPSILEILAAQDEEFEEVQSSNRWEVGPRVAPVFFSSLNQGSPIHSSFRDNAKSGNVNMSYGVSVSYEVAKRVKIRSGVHRVDFGYDTQNVSFSSSLNANTSGLIDNIDYTLSSKNLVVRSNSRSGKVASESAQDVAGPDPSLNGKMIQEFGYLEVPLELTYEILDRKLGVNLVGGVSSLFLLNNSVILEAEGNTTEMGEANNINDLNFSTNIGLGFSYRVNDKMMLNVEPMFKYQLNTFSDSSGNFQPFSMGVYSGLNFRF